MTRMIAGHVRGGSRRSSVPSGAGVSAAFVKDTLRCWLRGWKRFVSIAVITLLGVAVLTGIYAGCRDMFRAADRFYDAQGLHDIQVVSTAGLTGDDVAALRAVEGVDVVQAERTQSVTTPIDGTAKTVTIAEIGTKGLDRPYLVEGRLPAKAGEIAVTKKFLMDSGRKPGDRLTVTPEDSGGDSSAVSDSDTADSTEQAPSFPAKLTIVGEVLDPKDLSNPDGIGTEAFRQSATADYTFFAPSDGVTGDISTAISLTVKGAADEDTFSDGYDAAVGKVVDRIERTLQKPRQQERRQQLIDSANKRIDEAQSEAEQRFADAQAQLDQQRAQFDAQVAQLTGQPAQSAGQPAQGGAEARAAIIAKSPELQQAQARLDQAQADLTAQERQASVQVADQRAQVESKIAQVRWYVQTRSSIDGYSALDSDVSSIESIGRAFPVVFLLVAVLMSLTTMTRMVEEDRGLIGTYTGLGYGSAAIAMRYVLFAVLACLIGGGLGLVAGFVGIPAFLLVVLEGLYTIPGIRLEYDWLYGSAGIALFVAGILIATIAACAGELRQTPAALMRPKAPKAGTRVLLERIPPVWRHMSFLNKVTARNIARFKSRLVMTVGGVAGCTALIVCGLAINDSVATLGVKQYEDITRYSLMVVAGDSDTDAMRERVDEDGRATSTLDLRVESGELDADDSSESVELLVVPNKDAGRLDDMIALRDATGDHEELTLGTAGGSASGASGGVIVDQSAANALGVKAGDTVTLHDANMRIGEAKVAAVSRNLIGANVYMTETQYRNTFGVNADADVTLNARLAMLDGTADENIAYADKLARDPSVLSAVSTDKLERSFQFELMAAVVALIVGLAGGLALVVLFTLANTNVSERVREMATLKVLGFFDREVHLYVNKEMMILTVAGILVGLPLGRWVGGLLTAALAMPGMYFEVEVRPVSYLIAAAVTLAFTLLVQLLTNPVLDRIDPVGALKSVE